MNFLLDAQLPRRLVRRFAERGHGARHMLDLASGNETSDSDIAAYADREDFVVVSKDNDFVESAVLLGTPRKLLHISTGNISNSELEQLLISNFAAIERAFNTCTFVELSLGHVIAHR